MTDSIHIKNIPIFEKGIFQAHPAVFDRFLHHASDYMLEKFRNAQADLGKCEGTITWPLIVGPGFSGGTHPGADNIVIETMYAGHRHIYNSDCLYINPEKRIFAVSDPPGVTVSARALFEKLDRYLQDNSPDSLGTFINQLNLDTGYDDSATLSLVHLPQSSPEGPPAEAIFYNAGDSYLFHGKRSKGRLKRIDGSSQFIGTTHAHFAPQHIRLEANDFIIIASDGISTLSVGNKRKYLEPSLLKDLEGGPECFVSAVIQRTNGYFEQQVYGRIIPRFGGNDNVSILIINPDDLIDTDHIESFVLGGYIPDR